MGYAATTEQLIEDFQNYLDADPMLWDQNEGRLTWWGRVIMFRKNEDEITVEFEGESVTFPRP